MRSVILNGLAGIDGGRRHRWGDVREGGVGEKLRDEESEGMCESLEPDLYRYVVSAFL